MKPLTVICIDENWKSSNKADNLKPAPHFFDKDIVTDISENEDGRQFYHLAERFPENLGFSAENFVVADLVSEKEIMSPDEICNHLIDLEVRKIQESEKRLKTTKKILIGSFFLGLIGGFLLFKK
jgi:hypothetical protein